MNNILLLIIDSLNYSRVKYSDYELMPFLRSLEEKGVYCTNMYSEAPYTEAASMNIYCGQDTLDFNGYIFRYKDSPETLFERMQKCGYEVYYNSYQPQCHPTSVTRGVDALFYNVGFDLGAFWSYRLQHYEKLLKDGNLFESDYDTLKELFNDNFKGWLVFLNDLVNGDSSCEMITNNTNDFNAYEVRCLVQEEFEKYNEDEHLYIEEILTKGVSHRLFKIPAYVQNKKIQNREIPRKTKKLFKPVLKRIRYLNLRTNLRNNKGIFKGAHNKLKMLVKSPSKGAFKDYLKGLYVSINTIVDIDLFERIDKDCDLFKNAPSFYTHIDHYVNWVKRRSDDKPYFACIHVDDIHNPETFFTYDTEDIELLVRQKENAEELIKSLPKDYKGVISHDLSLRYIDHAIKDMFDMMQNNELLNNTTVIITADHGFSFAGYPVRDSFVINKYLENYNIPFVIYNSEIKSECINKICRSTDIPATIVTLAGGEIPVNFAGYSVLSEENHQYAIIEYCGGGCPDISRREFITAVFDDKWFVGIRYRLDDEISMQSVDEIYNLQKDPLQMQNLVKSSDYELCVINNMLQVVRERQNHILNTRI